MEVENNLIDSVDNREPVASFQSRFNISDNLSGNLKEMSKWIRRLLILTAIFIGIWVLCLLFILFVIATTLFAMPETLSFLPVTLSSLSFPILLLIISLGISVFILLKLWKGQKYIQESLQKQNEDLLYKGASNLMQYWKYTFYMQVVAIVLMFIGFVIGLLTAL